MVCAARLLGELDLIVDLAQDASTIDDIDPEHVDVDREGGAQRQLIAKFEMGIQEKNSDDHDQAAGTQVCSSIRRYFCR